MYSALSGIWNFIEDMIDDYLDIDITLWLLMPLLITFLLPLVIVLLLYITASILYVYRLHRHRLRSAYGTDWRNASRNVVAAVWDAHGWIWHGRKNPKMYQEVFLIPLVFFLYFFLFVGYEVVGLENIPTNEPVLFIYYHGAIPIDLYYFISKVFLFNSKLIHTVADRFLFKCPGWSIISDVLKVVPGTIQTCSTILKEGNMLAISPGGVYEAQFGDSYYQLMWKKRLGFAKVALDAKVSIIPLFTRNVREAFRTINWGRRWWLKLYAATRFPFVPIYGGFPVKLKTFIGKPIPYDENLTPEQLQIKVAAALDDLIIQHQKIPGSILCALVNRFYDINKTSCNLKNVTFKTRIE